MEDASMETDVAYVITATATVAVAIGMILEIQEMENMCLTVQTLSTLMK